MFLAINANHILSNIENHIFTDKEVKSYIYALVNYLDLGDYFKGVIIKTLKDKNLATYNLMTTTTVFLDISSRDIFRWNLVT